MNHKAEVVIYRGETDLHVYRWASADRHAGILIGNFQSKSAAIEAAERDVSNNGGTMIDETV